MLQFDGTSLSDGYGITIDNVKLTFKYDTTNFVANGDFSAPAVSGWKLFKDGIQGWWSAATAEVGDGKSNYHSKWTTGQVIELDSDSNQRYTQIINIPADVHQLYISKDSVK